MITRSRATLLLAASALLTLCACGTSGATAFPASESVRGDDSGSVSSASVSSATPMSTDPSTTAMSTAAPSIVDSSTTTADRAYPVTVSSCGVDYTYQHAPQRVMLGAPGIISTLDALGVADSAVGYTLSDYQIPGLNRYSGLTLTTADWTPSREFLISARPDLFLANDEQQLLGEGAASKQDLAAAGGNLYVLGSYCVHSPAGDTIDVVYNDITDLGAIYGVPDRAATLVTELKSRVAAAAALNNSGTRLTAGAITVADGKVYALSGSYYAAVLGALGLTNGFADLDSNWSEISPEAVLASDLDVILVTYSGDGAKAAIDQASAEFANAPAVRNHRVVAINDTAFQSVGVAIVDVIEDTARQLFGQ